MLSLHGDPNRVAAAEAAGGLLEKLKIPFAFVGEVAVASWLDEPLMPLGPVDVLALVGPDRARQIPMTASSAGFVANEEEIIRARELDLIPMTWSEGEKAVRVHVLFASNALYAMMVRDAVPVRSGELEFRAVGAEDLALLLVVADPAHGADVIERLRRREGAEFDRDRFNRKLVSIGLEGSVIE